MLVLLPPSEGKYRPASGPHLDLDSLFLSELSPARCRVLQRLVDVSAREDALEVLGVGSSLVGEVEANTRVFEAPCAPAHQIYTGVLYEGAQLNLFCNEQLSGLLVFSAAYGPVRATDYIAPYRLSGGVKLPELGAVSTFWKQHLDGFNEVAEGQFILDCRSGIYQKMWLPGAAQARDLQCELISVRVERMQNGRRKVVSHLAKHWRGILTRYLLQTPGLNSLDGLEELCKTLPPNEINDFEIRGEGGRWELTLIAPPH